jgi:hypothetical protein
MTTTNLPTIKNKSKLLCKGYAQVEGIEFEDTFSPVEKLQNLSDGYQVSIYKYNLRGRSIFRTT